MVLYNKKFKKSRGFWKRFQIFSKKFSFIDKNSILYVKKLYFCYMII